MLEPRAILVDLDNTLFHWDPCDEAARHAVHERFREELQVEYDAFMEMLRGARSHFKRQLCNQGASHHRLLFFKHLCDRLLDRPRPKLVLELYEIYWRVFFEHMQPQPDAVRVLAALSAKYPIALISNHTTQPQLEKIARLGFEPYATAILTSEEAGAEKPDPRLFRMALERLNAKPADAVMIGDHPRGDIEGAAALGITTIHSMEFTKDRAAEGAADYVIESLGEVLGLIKV